MMVDVYVKLIGKFGICMVICGLGVINVFVGVYVVV